MKLVSCLLLNVQRTRYPPLDDGVAANRLLSVVRVLSSRKCGFGVLEASCGVPETSRLSFDGSAEFCAGRHLALIESVACDFCASSVQSASLGVNRIAIWSAERAAACP